MQGRLHSQRLPFLPFDLLQVDLPPFDFLPFDLLLFDFLPFDLLPIRLSFRQVLVADAQLAKRLQEEVRLRQRALRKSGVEARTPNRSARPRPAPAVLKSARLVSTIPAVPTIPPHGVPPCGGWWQGQRCPRQLLPRAGRGRHARRAVCGRRCLLEGLGFRV